MTETFVLLLAAHILGDFVFQTRGMVAAKSNPAILALHGLIHLALAVALLGVWHPALALLAFAHIGIDAVKTYARLLDLRWFLIDQAAHLLTIVAVALLLPALWAASHWLRVLPAELAATLPLFWLMIAGFVTAVQAGGFAVGLLLAPYLDATPQLTQGSLPGAGALIGQLERAATYLLILLGQPTAVAFLVAAKSVLRFSTARDDRKISEYIIAGTLASISWALLTAMLVKSLAERLVLAMPQSGGAM